MSAAVTVAYERTEVRTARRRHRCWSWSEKCKAPGEGWDDNPPCTRMIEVGETYARSTIFPGHDSGYAGARGEEGARPVVSMFCMPCAGRWVNVKRGLDAIGEATP